MNNIELVDIFNSNLSEFERGLSNLKYQLAYQYQDAIQDTLIKLIQHNNKYGIDDDRAKQLMFISFRNTLIQANRNRIRTHTVDLDVINDIEVEEPLDVLSSIDEDNIKHIKRLLSNEQYVMLLNYYEHKSETPFNGKITRQIDYLKRKMGWKKEYILEIPGKQSIKFKYLSQISRYLNLNNKKNHISKYLNGSRLKYCGVEYKVITIITIKK